MFLYRYETRATLEGLGLHVPATLPDRIPTVYALDLTDASSFFLASRITMRKNDTIYVSNAPITDINRVDSHCCCRSANPAALQIRRELTCPPSVVDRTGDARPIAGRPQPV